ncbi:hypothetical protein WA026_011238 [Henosepilachna vigintioctopunctata]|uniref:RNA helicase n=1 Tax=Henosepilachna vigintioctopunctata TaxID=420089 RepID=A0AAW1U867_9CUCU
MGKKGHNWRGRQVVNTIIDDTETNKIQLDLKTDGHFDNSNALALPSKKRETKIKKDKKEIVRILSKKRRKKLEKIVEKRKKKDQRSILLEELQKVQLPSSEHEKLLSLSSVQTKGLKKISREANMPKKLPMKTNIEEDINNVDDVSEVTIEKKQDNKYTGRNLDPNVVGFDSSSDECSSDNENEIPLKKMKLENDAMAQPLKPTEICEKTVIEQKLIDRKEIPKKEEIVKKPAIYVDVIRDPEIQKARLKLPILAEEQQIMEIINANDIVIISGETGSGKTTQLPQFLFEAGYAEAKQIAVTEPRRIAAIAMSERVAKEMNMSNREISFLVRFQGNVTEDTKIKFMTDGVLLKEIESDFLLTNYSIVILDEAHERSLYTDILIGFLSRIVKLRKKRNNALKLIVMSATLRLEDFTTNSRLFSIPPPVVNVESRQFPVTVHFNRRTEEDYVKEAFKKTVKIHTTLPDGGILIFLTGEQEVNHLVYKLKKKFPYSDKSFRNKAELTTTTSEKISAEHKMKGKKAKKMIIPEINLNDYSLPEDSEEHSELEASDLEFDKEEEDCIESVCHGQPLWVLPLYSLLSMQKQNKIFQPVPLGCRLCVVSTNVAETSLTIPGIKYVVDSGKTKMKLYDKVTGVTRFEVHWTSKASADQRSGRAGRTGPGHCYRLYSSAVFNDTFENFSEPEIRRAPVDELYLRLRNMSIKDVINFPFPTPPDLMQLKMSETRLKILGVLDEENKVTRLGSVVAKYPVQPRFGKMLALSRNYDIMPYTIYLVAALSVPQVLLNAPTASTSDVAAVTKRWFDIRFTWANAGHSYLLGDNMVLLKALCGAEVAYSQGKLEQYCDDCGLRSKAVSEIRKLRLQLSKEVALNQIDMDIVVEPQLAPPNEAHAKLLRQILLCGLGDQIAKKMTLDEVPQGENKTKYKYAYHANNMEDLVFLHRSSIMKRTLPEFVVYQELYESNKIYMRGVTAIEPEWLPEYVPSLCNLSAPFTDPPPCFEDDIVMCTLTGTFGSQAWKLPEMKVEYPECEDAYKWFAKFLLEGVVVSKLQRFTSSLLSKPDIMTKKWAKLQPRTQSLLRALISKNVRQKTTLLDVWEEQPQYLLNEFLEWLPQSGHNEAASIWPPI